MLFNFVYSSEYVLPVSLENVITFLAFDNLVVTLGIKDYVNRDGVKSFARSPADEVGALLTSEWNRFLVVNRMRHLFQFIICKGTSFQF